jgi:hypothetical protein
MGLARSTYYSDGRSDRRGSWNASWRSAPRRHPPANNKHEAKPSQRECQQPSAAVSKRCARRSPNYSLTVTPVSRAKTPIRAVGWVGRRDKASPRRLTRLRRSSPARTIKPTSAVARGLFSTRPMLSRRRPRSVPALPRTTARPNPGSRSREQQQRPSEPSGREAQKRWSS